MLEMKIRCYIDYVVVVDEKERIDLKDTWEVNVTDWTWVVKEKKIMIRFYS